MMPFFNIYKLVVIFSILPLFSAYGGEMIRDIPTQAIESTSESTGSHILEGKLVNIEGEFWLVEDKANKHHKIHIGSDTTLPQPPKQSGDSIQAVVRKNGHAIFIQ